MTILQIASGNFFSTYGGGQVYVKNIVDEMLKQKQEVIVCSFSKDHPHIIKKTYKNAPLYEIGYDSLSELSDLLSNIHPDIIHAHSQKALITQLGRKLNIPVIVTAHHGGILCPAGTLMNQRDEICTITACHKNCLPCYLKGIRSGKYWYPLMKYLSIDVYQRIGNMLHRVPFIPFITPIGKAALCIRDKQIQWSEIATNCSKMIAPSNAIAQTMVRNGLSPKKVIVIPHGIPLPDNLPSYPSTENGIKFFFVGRICYVKGIHVLLEAFDGIHDKNAELHLIGSSGNKEEERYKKQLQTKYSDNKQIIWHGKVEPEQIFNMISKYHILIHPTICLEIFGLNISEALAMGKPVLATRCGGAEMQIEEGINGWLVKPNHIIELKEIIEKLTIKKVAIHSNYTVASIDKHCKSLINLYETVTH